MRKKIKMLTHAAVIAAVYVILTHLQNFLLPGTTTMAIQFRLSEALCVLAFFTPGAISGLGLGCFLFNLTSGSALPVDFLVGTAASTLSAWAMWGCRNVTVKGFPLLGLLMPAIFNALLVGWELYAYTGVSFWVNALYVFIGEAAVTLTLGSGLYYLLKKENLYKRILRPEP